MAGLYLNYSYGGSTSGTFDETAEVWIDYTASNGTFTLNDIQAKRGDGYRSYNVYDTSVSVKVGGTSKSVGLGHYVDFGANSWVSFSPYSTSWSGLSGSSISVTITMPTGGQAYSGSVFTGTASMSWTTYTVSYNANGGKGAPGSQTKTYGTALTLSSTKPTRTGYTFQGWGTSSSDTTVDYKPGASYTSNSSITLYAIWKINTWTVSYNANGGSGAPGSQTKTYGKTLTLSSTKPTRTGYTFKQWNTNSGGTGTAYNPGASYTANSGATLYAIWTENQLTVNYYSNYATSSFSNPANAVGADKNVIVLTQKFNYSTAYNNGLTDYSYFGAACYLARTGYTATGNYGTTTTGGTLISEKTSFASGQAFAEAFGKSLKTGNASVNVYPQWQIITYNVTYNANAGSDSVTNMPSAQIKTYGQTLQLSSSIPIRDRYEFLGWATSPEGTVSYAAGSDYTANSEVVLYAVWELSASRITVYDSEGKPHKGLVYFYNSSGEMHYGIITVYDSSGKAHQVI